MRPRGCRCARSPSAAPGASRSSRTARRRGSAITCLVWSASPTLTPPEVITASAALAAARKAAVERRRIVADDAHVDQIDTQALQHAPQRVAIAVVDAALVERLADGAQFVAGGKEGDAQAPPDRHLGAAERCEQAEIGRPQDAPGTQRRFAALQVFAGEAAVVASAHHAGGNRHTAVRFTRELLRHDGIGAGRHDRARHDADAGAGPHRAGERNARQCASDDLELAVRIGRQCVRREARSRPSPSCRAPAHSTGEIRSCASTRPSAARSATCSTACTRGTRRRMNACACCDRQRVGIVAVEAGCDLLQRGQGGHVGRQACDGCEPHPLEAQRRCGCSASSSSRVFALRKALASSNSTSTQGCWAVQRSILRSPEARKRIRLSSTSDAMRQKTG